jgi:hypothetical protein
MLQVQISACESEYKAAKFLSHVWESALDAGGCRLLGCRHRRCRLVATSTYQNPPRRQGPPALTATDGVVCQATCRHWLWRQVGAVVGREARAMCRLARQAATQMWSLLTKKFRDGLFYHFISAGDPMCQKFGPRPDYACVPGIEG